MDNSLQFQSTTPAQLPGPDVDLSHPLPLRSPWLSRLVWAALAVAVLLAAARFIER